MDILEFDKTLAITSCCFQWQTVCKLKAINSKATEKQQPTRYENSVRFNFELFD